MGGNALKSTFTRRYEKKEFFVLWEELKEKLKSAFDTDVELVVSLNNKEDFGDMDILVLNYGQIPRPEEIKKILEDEFNANEVFRNSTIYSFDYKELQVDLIFTPTRNWETSQIFFAYNDLGNLMGKIFHKLGLSYGFEGLKYIYRINDSRILEEFVVSKDMPKIFSFIGLSWERFQEGFDEVEDIFEYVISSPYFEPSSFYLENLDQKNRKRNKKRKNYALFVQYIEEKFGKDDKDRSKRYHYDPDKEKYWPMIHEHFKDDIDFLGKLEKLNKKEEYRLNVAAKYNGRIIMELIPELSGAELGRFIKDHRIYIPTEVYCSLDDVVYMNTAEDVKEMILKFYKNVWTK